jgi:hypothetical protein
LNHLEETLNDCEDQLNKFDSTICIEIGWFRHMGSVKGGKTIINNKLLLLLPVVKGEHDAKTTLNAVKQLQLDPLYTYLSADLQSDVKFVHDMLQSLAMRKLPPIATCNGNPFKEAVKNSFKFYCWEKISPASGSAASHDTLVCGEDAVAIKVSLIVEHLAAGKALTYDVLKPLHVFNWLLSQDEKDQHSKWVASMFKGTSVLDAAKKRAAELVSTSASAVAPGPSAKKKATATAPVELVA